MRRLRCIAFVVLLAVAGMGCINSVAALDAGLRVDAPQDTSHAMDVSTTDVSADAPPAVDAGTDAPARMDAVTQTDAGTPDVPPPSITLSGTASAMAFNGNTGTVYVALACNGGTAGCASLPVGEQSTLGIAVIDATSNTQTSTIPALTPPGGGMGSAAYNAMAVDPVANVLYVSAGSGFVWTINGMTNTMSGSITGAGLTGTQVQALAVDPVAHVLYVAAATSATTVNLVMIDTTTNTMTGAPIPLMGLSGAWGVALDTTHQRVFVCGTGGDVAEVDTATGAVLGDGGVINYPGQGPAVACDGLPGYAEMVTEGEDGGAGVIHALELMDYPLSSDFAPASAATVQFTGQTVATYAFGIRAENAHVAYSYVEWNIVTSSMVGSGGPTVVFTTPAGPVGPARIVRTGATSFDVYVVTNAVTNVALMDGGTDMVPTVSTINRITIPVPATL